MVLTMPATNAKNIWIKFDLLKEMFVSSSIGVLSLWKFIKSLQLKYVRLLPTFYDTDWLKAFFFLIQFVVGCINPPNGGRVVTGNCQSKYAPYRAKISKPFLPEYLWKLKR